MNRITTLFLVLAAMGLVAAKPEEEKAIPEPADVQQYRGQYIVPDERSAAAELDRLPATYAADESGRITRVVLADEGLQCKQELDLRFLSNLSHLEELILINIPLEPHGMDSIPTLKRLKSLEFTFTRRKVPDENMAALGKMRQLRILRFGASGPSDAGMAQLENLRGLEELHLSGLSIDDAFLRHISRLDKLRTLAFDYTNVTDAGLKAIAGLVNLEFLELPENSTDAAFEHLRKLVKLRRLAPVGKITDHGVAYLANMVEMEELDFNNASLTNGGLLSSLFR